MDSMVLLCSFIHATIQCSRCTGPLSRVALTGLEVDGREAPWKPALGAEMLFSSHTPLSLPIHGAPGTWFLVSVQNDNDSLPAVLWWLSGVSWASTDPLFVSRTEFIVIA